MKLPLLLPILTLLVSVGCSKTYRSMMATGSYQHPGVWTSASETASPLSVNIHIETLEAKVTLDGVTLVHRLTEIAKKDWPHGCGGGGGIQGFTTEQQTFALQPPVEIGEKSYDRILSICTSGVKLFTSKEIEPYAQLELSEEGP